MATAHPGPKALRWATTSRTGTARPCYEAQDAAKKLARGDNGGADNAPITVDGALKDHKRDLEATQCQHLQCPFGFDVEGESKDKHLVPNPTEQAALARGKALQSKGVTLRAIASIWAGEFGLKKLDANGVRRILDRA